jgi:phospholipase C
MEENRSFDQLFGFNTALNINRLQGNESNPLNTQNPAQGSVKVSNDSPYVGPCDPCHGTPCTTQKIFGNAGMPADKVAKMDGFIGACCSLWLVYCVG